MFNSKLAEQHLNTLLKEYGITVKSWSTTSCGRAWCSTKTVKIPYPTNIDRFCVAMHELGHIIKYANKRTMKLYQSEYIAEMYAIEQAELLGFDCSEYKERARRYIIMNIAKGFCRGLNLLKLESDIIKFCDIDFTKWYGKKVFISNWGHNKGELIINLT